MVRLKTSVAPRTTGVISASTLQGKGVVVPVVVPLVVPLVVPVVEVVVKSVVVPVVEAVVVKVVDGQSMESMHVIRNSSR